MNPETQQQSEAEAERRESGAECCEVERREAVDERLEAEAGRREARAERRGAL